MHRRMVWVGCVVLVLALAVAVYANQRPSAAPRAEVGRYQLVVYSNSLCKMDTSTGQIWVLTTGMEDQFAFLLQGMGIEINPQWRDLDDLYKSLSGETEK